MATLSRDTVRDLVAFDSKGSPVVSIYLDVDGRRWVRPLDYEKQLSRLVDGAAGETGKGEIAEDLRRVREHVGRGFDRSKVRGLAIFSCVTRGLWSACELPVAPRSQITVNQTPHVAQLKALMESFHRLGILAADRQRARMFVYEMENLTHAHSAFDELPRHEDDKGDWDRDHVHDHQAAVAQHHLRKAAGLAFSVWREQGFDLLVLACPDEMARDLERAQHPYMKERLAARVAMPANASDAELQRAAADVEVGLQAKRQQDAVSELRRGLETGKAVVGLAGSLGAIVERRAEVVALSHGYSAPGWRCDSCGSYAAKGPSCRACQGRMSKVDDVVGDALSSRAAAATSIVVCDDSPDLDVLGRIGVILRY